MGNSLMTWSSLFSTQNDNCKRNARLNFTRESRLIHFSHCSYGCSVSRDLSMTKPGIHTVIYGIRIFFFHVANQIRLWLDIAKTKPSPFTRLLQVCVCVFSIEDACGREAARDRLFVCPDFQRLSRSLLTWVFPTDYFLVFAVNYNEAEENIRWVFSITKLHRLVFAVLC